MNYTAFLFVLLSILFGIKHFVSGLDIRKDSWLTADVEEQKNMISDDIRCFCNLPQCVSTGYMCRTARYGNNSGCFSEIAKTVITIDSLSSMGSGSNPPSSVTRHGCIELLNVSHQRHRCDKNLTKLKLKLAQNKHHDNNINFLLLCCHEDMCNHIDNPENQKIKLDIGEHIDSSVNIENSLHLSGNHQNLNDNDLNKLKNHSKLSSSLSSSLPSSSLLSSSSSSLSSATATTTTTIFSSLGHSNNDDWFRIATIAVPICGAVILFSLIAIAMKILRTDRSTSISLKLDNNHSSSITSTTTSCNGGIGGGIGGTSSVIKDFNRKFIILDHEAQILKNHNNIQQNQSSNLLEQYTINNYNKMNINSNSNNIECNNSNNDNNLCCDKKNETRAKINQLLNIQYSLLPQQSTTSMLTPTTILPINLDDDNNDNDDEDDAGELIKNSLINDSNNYNNINQNNKLLLTNGNNNNNNNINNNNVIGNALLNSKLFYKNLNNLNSNNSCNNNNNVNNVNNNFNCNNSLLLGTSNNTNNMLIDKHNKIYVKDILSPISENWISEDNNSDSTTAAATTTTTTTININENVQKLNNI